MFSFATDSTATRFSQTSVVNKRWSKSNSCQRNCARKPGVGLLSLIRCIARLVEKVHVITRDLLERNVIFQLKSHD